MIPGDKVTTQLTLVSGTLPLTYSLSTSGTNPDNKGLAAQLTLSIKTGKSQDGCTNANFDLSPDGVQTLYSGALIGTNILSSQPIAASASDVLCLQAKLPATLSPATLTALEAAMTSVTLTFTAQQVG